MQVEDIPSQLFGVAFADHIGERLGYGAVGVVSVARGLIRELKRILSCAGR